MNRTLWSWWKKDPYVGRNSRQRMGGTQHIVRQTLRLHWVKPATLLAAMCSLAACGGTSGGSSDSVPASEPSSSEPTSSAQSSTEAGSSASLSGGSEAPMQSASGSASGAPTSTAGTGGSSAHESPPPRAAGGPKAPPQLATAAGGSAAPKPPEMLDPKVDWKALKLVYPTLYSAYDGVHTFQVPVHIDGTTVELSGWSAIPSDAVAFDPDPDNKGVMITMLKAVADVTIAARTGGSTPLGGTATLHITESTPEEWALGQQRYMTGEDWNPFGFDPGDLPPELQGMDISNWTLDQFIAVLGPDRFYQLLAEFMDKFANMPPPPTNLKCTNCHGTGAKYLEVQHTPTQVALVSDEDLGKIFTMGMKPAYLGFHVLPMLAQEQYTSMHRWMATDDEVKGLIVYLRSLTPQGQGDVLGPNGQYFPADPDAMGIFGMLPKTP